MPEETPKVLSLRTYDALFQQVQEYKEQYPGSEVQKVADESEAIRRLSDIVRDDPVPFVTSFVTV